MTDQFRLDEDELKGIRDLVEEDIAVVEDVRRLLDERAERERYLAQVAAECDKRADQVAHVFDELLAREQEVTQVSGERDAARIEIARWQQAWTEVEPTFREAIVELQARNDEIERIGREVVKGNNAVTQLLQANEDLKRRVDAVSARLFEEGVETVPLVAGVEELAQGMDRARSERDALAKRIETVRAIPRYGVLPLGSTHHQMGHATGWNLALAYVTKALEGGNASA